MAERLSNRSIAERLVTLIVDPRQFTLDTVHEAHHTLETGGNTEAEGKVPDR